MQIVEISNVQTMTTREIADIAEASHDNVVKSIRALIAGGGVFKTIPIEQSYVHPQNKQTYTEYVLGYRDTMVVISGYSAPVRAKIIDRWQELEAHQVIKVPTTLSGALRLAAEQAEQIEAQQLQLEAQKPAVEFLERYFEAKSAKGIREVAKVLGIKERQFIEMLESNGVLFRQGKNLLPMAQYQHSGYFEVKTGESNGHAYLQTRFTPECVAWIAKKVTKLWTAK